MQGGEDCPHDGHRREPFSPADANRLGARRQCVGGERERRERLERTRREQRGRPARAVTLTPKGKSGASLTRAKIWIDAADGTLRQFEAEELSGVVRLVKINTFVANAAVPEGTFRFKPPRGVRIVDQSDLP